MRKIFSKIDKIIILCKNVQKTSALYSQTLGLKVHIQSPSFVQLRDKQNTAIYLQQSKNISQLTKGYSPIISFNVQNFDEVYKKLVRYDLSIDGDIIDVNGSKLANFVGFQGQIISINNMVEEQQTSMEQSKTVDNDEIRQLLQKIKL